MPADRKARDRLVAAVHEGPLGPLAIVGSRHGISSVRFTSRPPARARAATGALGAQIAQLDEYFAGRRRAFAMQLDLHGSAFQLAVWEQLLRIPYGSTTSYGAIAAALDADLYERGSEQHMRPRAVGAAVGANPIAIIVPCHRVVGADGSLTGYRGGLARKAALLELEGAHPGRRATSGPESAQLALC